MARGRAAALAATVAAVLALSACGGGGSDGGGGGASGGGDTGDNALLVWTTEDQEDRVATQKAVLDTWAKGAGATVELVPIAEDQLSTVLASAIAADKAPDVIGALSLPGVQRLQTDQLLDTEGAKGVVDALGADTFVETALSLTRSGETQLAVPSDGWAQLLFYRKDLFEKAGVQPPTTYDAIKAAATALNTGGTTGIVAATAPNDSFTQQTFEHLALANDCELAGDDGAIALGSPQCTTSFDYYTSLIKEASSRGNQDADTTRASYFAGKAGMVIWSSFLLDELAGLRNDALPTCPECKADKTFLATNTGIVPALQGPDAGEPAAFGEIVSWALIADGNAKAREMVQYALSDGYEQWLAVAPEGKLPVRRGNASDAEAYVKAWQALEAGVDTKAPLSEFYDAETLGAIAASPQTFSRWGIPQGQGALAGALAGQFIVPKALSAAINGSGTGADAQAQAVKEAETLKQDLGG